MTRMSTAPCAPSEMQTTVLYRLHLSDVIETQPTIGSNVEEVVHRNIRFQVRVVQVRCGASLEKLRECTGRCLPPRCGIWGARRS